MILTDEERAKFVNDICEYGTDFVSPLFATVEAIESAVLRKLRERPADAWATPFGEVLNAIGLDELPWPDWTPLHIIPEEHE